MIIHVANPIYDSVFKYIMEDERIAKTILSALLRKEVVHVAVRPHEYSNTTRDTLSMFRIDFAATVREREDGGTVKDRVVLIELQKTWLNTETLRFRQYLGAQYGNKNNIRHDTPERFAYPMVAVYLLGHRVGDIKEPIVYVNHGVYDYDGRMVKDGGADPFVESLTHDSIIVQIPLLRGNVNNRLEKVLSVFDQTRKDTLDAQVLNIDEDAYAGDADMMYMLHRLTAAAADSEMRQDMNVEDEYYQAIEDRDTAIMQREKMLKERDNQLKERDNQLKDRDNQLKESNKQLKERDSQLKESKKKLEEREMRLKENEKQLSESQAQLKSMAEAMLKNGMSESLIAQATGMGLDDIRKLLSR